MVIIYMLKQLVIVVLMLLFARNDGQDCQLNHKTKLVSVSLTYSFINKKLRLKCETYHVC